MKAAGAQELGARRGGKSQKGRYVCTREHMRDVG